MTTRPYTQTTLRPHGRWLAGLFGDTHAWLIILLILPAMLPLAAPGYFFKAHDAHHSVNFLVEFDQAIHDGALWPVWTTDQAVGFGYPLWLLYAPLTYFAAEAFHLLGLGFTAAIKATWAWGFILGALGTYRRAVLESPSAGQAGAVPLAAAGRGRACAGPAGGRGGLVAGASRRAG